MKPTTCFAPAHILLPSEQVPLEQWGCIACDQFTSDRSYWQRAEKTAAGAPSTLNLILPEVYLEDGDADARVEKIHATMQDYARNVLTRAVDGFIYVERTEQSGRVRQGLPVFQICFGEGFRHKQAAFGCQTAHDRLGRRNTECGISGTLKLHIENPPIF